MHLRFTKQPEYLHLCCKILHHQQELSAITLHQTSLVRRERLRRSGKFAFIVMLHNWNFLTYFFSIFLEIIDATQFEVFDNPTGGSSRLGGRGFLEATPTCHPQVQGLPRMDAVKLGRSIRHTRENRRIFSTPLSSRRPLVDRLRGASLCEDKPNTIDESSSSCKTTMKKLIKIPVSRIQLLYKSGQYCCINNKYIDVFRIL